MPKVRLSQRRRLPPVERPSRRRSRLSGVLVCLLTQDDIKVTVYRWLYIQVIKAHRKRIGAWGN